MSEPTDNTAEIAFIRELLNSGATEIEQDGERVKIDHNQLRRRLRELLATDAENPIVRPRFASIDVSNAW